MKASQFLISTLKEAPADAEVASHKLMMRAGMVKKLGAGIYSYMPMGLRVIRKVEAIVREEMNRAGAIEITMPVVQPAELWQETGRFEKMGPEFLDHAGAHHQFMAGDLGVGGGFFEGGDQELGGFHRVIFPAAGG